MAAAVRDVTRAEIAPPQAMPPGQQLFASPQDYRGREMGYGWVWSSPVVLGFPPQPRA
jgi:hypothetical protein